MAEEIELKLALTEEAQRNFLRHPLLRKAASKQSFRLINLYYDTPRLDLRKRGIALRLRAQGKLWLQTVKCAGRAAGGLSARPEWEMPYVGHFDFGIIDDDEVRAWLEQPKIRARIAPIFETNFQRITWHFEPARGTHIALMLDRGWIAAGGRREAISEVEIELMRGDEARLFDLARTLAERTPLAPAPLSKADRGYRLFKQTPAAPVKAAPIPLAAGASPAEAFRLIALSCLDHLQQNHQGAIASDDPEYIHQMRVAARRLRAALRLFGPLLPTDFAAPLLPPLHELMTILGHARDLDVLQAEIAEPVMQALPDEPRLAALIGVITERRFDARQDATGFLRSPRHGALVLQTLAILHAFPSDKVGAGETTALPGGRAKDARLAVADGGTPPATPEQVAETLLGFAANRLTRLRKKVLALATAASTDDPRSLHALRIGIKRLRYALEFFAPLASGKSMHRMLARLSSLQETLGQINDLANAGEHLMDCAADDPRLREAVTLIGGWHGPRHQKLLAALPRELKRLGRLRLPRLVPVQA